MDSVRDDYRLSVKRAILDLSLRDPEEAVRIKAEAAGVVTRPPLSSTWAVFSVSRFVSSL
jgi:hypothetical protein